MKHTYGIRKSREVQLPNAETAATHRFTKISFSFYKTRDCKGWKAVVLNEIFLVTFDFPCVHAHPTSPSLPFRIFFFSEFYPPPLFSLPFCRFPIFSVRDSLRILSIIGRNPEHRFPSRSGNRSSLSSGDNSSYPIILSPTIFTPSFSFQRSSLPPFFSFPLIH